MGNLVELKREQLRAVGIPLSPATFRRWSHTGKNKWLFRKIGHRVFLYLPAWRFWERTGKPYQPEEGLE